jgi:PKD repeat protein
MRSIRLLAATTVILSAAWACGGDGGGVEPNLDPVASFTVGTCTVGVACTFTDTSSDPDGTITSRRWLFGDGSAEVTDPGLTPSHTYNTAGSYNVTLTVTDNGGKTNARQTGVVVSAATANVPPTASFVAPTTCAAGAACPFHSSSIDTDGTITLTHWNFGDGGEIDGVDAMHTYAAAGTFNVALTVTDDDGATHTTTQAVTVSPAASLDCTPTDVNEIDCALNITQATAQVKVTLTGLGCELVGNRVFVPPPQPAAQDIFSNVCFFGQVGDEKILVDDAGAPLTLAAGSQLHVRFKRGTGTPPPGAPAANVVGTFPNWTINIDDGGNLGGPGEPDFTDVVLTVQATPAP